MFRYLGLLLLVCCAGPAAAQVVPGLANVQITLSHYPSSSATFPSRRWLLDNWSFHERYGDDATLRWLEHAERAMRVNPPYSDFYSYVDQKEPEQVAREQLAQIKQVTLSCDGRCLVDKSEDAIYFLGRLQIASEATIDGPGLLSEPVEDVENGRETVALWQSKAETGEVLHCEGQECYVAIRARYAPPIGARPSAETPALPDLALCKIIRVGDQYGSPEDCAVAAWTERGRRYVEAVGAKFNNQLARAPHLLIEVLTHFRAEPQVPIARMLVQVLQAPPLSYTTTTLNPSPGHSEIVAVAQRRTSSILNATREWPTVRVGVEEPARGDAKSFIKVELGVELYVSSQADPANDDWHAANDDQAKAYRTVLETRIRDAMAAGCGMPTWENELFLECTAR